MKATALRLVLSAAVIFAAQRGLSVADATTINAAAADAAVKRRIAGIVFEDANLNGRRDTDEAGIAGAAVSDLHDVAVTGPDGRYSLMAANDAAVMFVSIPDGWTPAGRSWRLLQDAGPRAPGPAEGAIDFPLTRRAKSASFTFLHASDTHLSEESLPRLHRLRAIVETTHPDFVLITGDLIKDALRVGESEARPLYELLSAELKKFPVPVFCVPGNHDIFGIERHLSLVSPKNPLYGRALCRRYVGPEYYSFNWGGIHFLALDSVDYDDLWYYGHLDAAQVAWVEKDLAVVPASVPVVTFNHIPFVSSVERLSGYTDDPPAPTLIRVGGRMQYRHVVSNVQDLLDRLGGHRLEIALGGHLHTSESIALDTTIGRVRFHQTAAVVGPSEAPGLHFVSGVTLYRAKEGHVDDGTFLPLD